MNARLCVFAAAVPLAAAVALGAFGAHAVKTRLAPESFTVYQTAVKDPVGGPPAGAVLGSPETLFARGTFGTAEANWIKGGYAALSDPAQRQQYHIENRVSSDPHRNQSKDCTKGWRR